MRMDLHSHSIYSDGENRIEEMVKAAIAKGLDCFGISDHSYTSFDQSYCMNIDAYDEYKEEIRKLKEKYEKDIRLSCGIEFDYFSDFIPEGFDYMIGSLHYLKINGEYLPVDLDRETFIKIAKDHFGNDFYALCEVYYETLSNISDRCKIDIVGHFDLVSKYNEGQILFDENDPRYVSAWKKAMLKLLKDVKCFEINYGAVNKGLKSTPYLSRQMIEFLMENHGNTISSSDAHNIDNVGRFGNDQ